MATVRPIPVTSREVHPTSTATVFPTDVSPIAMATVRQTIWISHLEPVRTAIAMASPTSAISPLGLSIVTETAFQTFARPPTTATVTECSTPVRSVEERRTATATGFPITVTLPLVGPLPIATAITCSTPAKSHSDSRLTAMEMGCSTAAKSLQGQPIATVMVRRMSAKSIQMLTARSMIAIPTSTATACSMAAMQMFTVMAPSKEQTATVTARKIPARPILTLTDPSITVTLTTITTVWPTASTVRRSITPSVVTPI